ncbi:protein STPG4 isoform X1 [Hippoglossus hippoglossus]|uniref:protein STPG4 n=1 Tax=Hippoglossus stenolepis TaxID=195615 RepID=UPI00148D64D0|nr:protein STPG4 isoform X1 [Hippoglossus hippoglossus]XP_047198152.1 protein STPG4 [Hippoglossus stenolepis]
MSRAQDTVTWKHKAASKVADMSRGGNRTDKGDDRVDLCGRGSWWLRTLKDTPLPGLYHIRDFIEEAELNPVKKTYGFKGVGRKAKTLGVRNGELLMPGAYDYIDSTQEVLMNQASYSFKNCPRPDIDTLGIRDKHINTSPCDYDVTAKPVEKTPCKHAMFRSTVQRISFPPREGPAPCRYNPQTRPGKGITSCFKSTLPRLHYVDLKTPGPGAYEPNWKFGGPLNTEVMDPSFSLFFRSIP